MSGKSSRPALGHTRKSRPSGIKPQAETPPKRSRTKLKTTSLFVITNLVSLSLGLVSTTFGPRIVAAVEQKVDAGPLIVTQQDRGWPFLNCSDHPAVAMMNSAIPVAAFPGIDERDAALQAGAAAWNQGHITLAAFTPDNISIFVHKLQVQIFKHDENVTPAWTLLPSADGCGGQTTRVFSANLDANHTGNEIAVLDRGVEDGGVDGEDKSKVKSSPLGPTFTASMSDPAKFRLDVSSCTGYTEWGLKIYYNHGGTEFVKEFGSAENPFRIVGTAKPVPKFRDSDPTPTREQPDSSCMPRFTKKLSSQTENPATACNAKQFLSLSGPLLPNEEVDELVCRGDLALRHTQAELVQHGGYQIFHRQGNSWQLASGSREGNAVVTDDLTQSGISPSEFTQVFNDCIHTTTPSTLFLKQCG
jgi:hypothetical protein